MTPTRISPDMTIPQIVKAYPDTQKVFATHGIHVEGYKAIEHESLFATARVHQLDLSMLLAELNQATK